MKSCFLAFIFLFTVQEIYGQPQGPSEVLLRHDTTYLKSGECDWIIRSLVKNDPETRVSLGRNVVQVLFYLAKQGKITLYDYETDKPIPGKEIYTWHMPVDSVQTYDDAGNPGKIQLVSIERNTSNYNQLRVYTDWYLDVANGKIRPRVKWVDLMAEVQSPSTGIFLGYVHFCRMYY